LTVTKRFIIAAATFITAALYGFSDDKPVQIAFEVESGALKVLYHTYRVGAGSSTFNFVTQGGQEILFPFERLTASTTLIDRHQIRFLYQSLELNTRITARENFTIDNVSFNTGDVVDITYGFPFYRFTYLYDFLPGESELALGAALQFRNASISFTSADGTKRAISQNLGLVPALAVSGRFPFATHFFAAFDATGIYASSAFFNGANFSFEGSILDASVRGGMKLQKGLESYINLRFIGGSAAGVSQYPSDYWTQSIGKDTANYLATMALTVGATLTF